MSNRVTDKSYLTISEFSKIVGISVDKLRYYDNSGIFHPAKHGEGEKSKYRYYSPSQITAINMIRVLSEIGIQLKTIKKIAGSRTPENMLKLLSKQRYSLIDKLHSLQDAYAVIDTYIELLISGISAIENEITLAEMPEVRITLGNDNDFSDSYKFFREFICFCNTPHKPMLNLAYPIGGFFKDMTAFLDEPSQPTRFFSLDPKGRDHKEAGLYLVGYTRGYYGETNDLPKRMVAFAKDQELVFSGPVYNTYLFDEVSVSNPNKYLLQVAASVTRTQLTANRQSNNRY